MLGKIQMVPLRSIWKNEAQDFTPWLADNIEELGEALGLELEYEDREVSVGPYSADILARDAGTGKYVVIENQLEKTNHDHLGKCITYSAVLDASAVVWIASDFTEEHKKALDWLNDHTSDEIAFYGVKLELIKIDNSLPAIQFNIQSIPNEVVRQAVKSKESGELSDTKKIQLQFWDQFREALAKTGKVRALQKSAPKYWYDIALGKSGVHLSNIFNTNSKRIGLRVYIKSTEVEEWLPYFEESKQVIEEEIGDRLEWNPNPTKKDKIIALNRGFDYEKTESWDEGINWLVQKTIIFKKVFGDLIKQHS
jgi:hypothetical protein